MISGGRGCPCSPDQASPDMRHQTSRMPSQALLITRCRSSTGVHGTHGPIQRSTQALCSLSGTCSAPPRPLWGVGYSLMGRVPDTSLGRSLITEPCFFAQGAPVRIASQGLTQAVDGQNSILHRSLMISDAASHIAPQQGMDIPVYGTSVARTKCHTAIQPIQMQP